MRGIKLLKEDKFLENEKNPEYSPDEAFLKGWEEAG
jgi:hypothetical protein